MLRLKRRTFLNSAALALASWGLDATGISPWAHRYGQALAQPAQRKFAVLIGINEYAKERCGCLPLEGCITDLELQHQLLAYRFGFRWEDIYTLVDQNASRSGIEQALETHLLNQVQQNDLVVVHFSGYGSRMVLDGLEPQATLVASDSVSPRDQSQAINDFPLESLRLLLRVLPSDRLITVLDTSFTLPPSSLLRSAARLRSRPMAQAHTLNPEAVAFQNRLRAKLEASPDMTSTTSWPGLLLTAATSEQVALEVRGDDFAAGVFTACLTRQLWQAVPASTIYIDVQRLQNRTSPIVWQVQTPLSKGTLGNTINLQDLGLIPTLSQGLEGVITTIDRSRQEVELWLGGLSNPILKTYGLNSAFRLAQTDPHQPEVVVQVTQRNRFQAKARILSSQGVFPDLNQVFVGQGIQEKIRLLPQTTSLMVALGSHLDRIERVDATSAFAALNGVTVVSQSDQPADYVFDRLGYLYDNHQDWEPYRVSYPSSRYGLSAPGQDTLPGASSNNDEAVKTAVQRLDTRLQSLLAIKILGLLENSAATHVPLALDIGDSSTGTRLVDYRAERALERVDNGIPSNSIPLVNLAVGHSLQYRFYNQGDRPLYGLLLVYEPNGNFSVGYPSGLITLPQTPPSDWLIPPQSQALSSSLDGVMPGLTPEVSLMLIVSRRPLQKTLKAIAASLGSGINTLRPLGSPLPVAQALVQDLQEASRETWADSGRSDALALDMSAWVGLRLTCQIQY